MTNKQRQPAPNARPKQERRVHLAPAKTEHLGPYRQWFSVQVESGVIGLQATPETGIGGDGPIYEACGGRCSMQGLMAAARTTHHILIEDEPKEGDTLVRLEAGDSVVFDNDEPGIPPINLSLTNEGQDQATALVAWLRNGPDDSTPDPRTSPRS